MNNKEKTPKKNLLHNKTFLGIAISAILVVIIVAVLIVIVVAVERNSREITVRFMNGDELYKEITITRKDKVDFATLSKGGYRFLGWKAEEGDDLVDQQYFKEYDYLSDVTLYAVWEIIDPVTVKYESRGGTPVESVEVPRGYPLEVMGSSTREGYILLGWSYDTAGLRIYNEHIVSDNMTLYAKWIPKEIDDTDTVDVIYETGDAPNIDPAKVKLGTELIYPEVHYAGYALEGWYCDREFTIKPDVDVLVTQTCMIYAKWREVEEKYKITIIAPENAPSFSTRDYLYDEHISRDDFDFTWNDFHELVGVFEDEEYETPAVFDYFIREDHTYYLKYNELVAVRVNVYFYDDNDLLSSQIYSEGERISRYTPPEKEGYYFDNWYADKGLTVLFDFDTAVAYNGLMIYAKYLLETQYEDDYFIYEEVIDLENGNYLKAVSEKDRSVLTTVIADKCNGLEVREIAASLFQGRYMQSITIGANVRIIGDRAFEDNDIRTIVIPASVRSIGWRAFFGSRITEVTIVGQPKIESDAFAQCSYLKTFSAPNVYSIGDRAFDSCYKLETVDIQSVTSVGECIFKDCINLESVDLSSTSIQSLPNSMFSGCATLESFTIPSSVTELEVSCFGGSGLISINTNNVVKIASSAFGRCDKLKTVTIGKALEKIDPSSFAECTALESFTVISSNPNFSSNGDGCLYNKTSEGATILLLFASSQSEYTLPQSIQAIEPQAFAYTRNLKTIKVAAGNEKYAALDGNLYNIDYTDMIHYASAKEDSEFYVPDSVIKISSFCFMEAKNLVCVYLGKNVKNLAVWSFYGLSSLEKIVCATNDVVVLNGEEVVDMVSVYNCPKVVIEYPEE